MLSVQLSYIKGMTLQQIINVVDNALCLCCLGLLPFYFCFVVVKRLGPQFLCQISDIQIGLWSLGYFLCCGQLTLHPQASGGERQVGSILRQKLCSWTPPHHLLLLPFSLTGCSPSNIEEGRVGGKESILERSDIYL